jgi:NACHT domain
MSENLNAILISENSSFQHTTQTFQQALEAVYQSTILEMLHFANLGQRFRELRDAHEGTFGWIFSNPDLVFEKEPKLTISFPKWLSEGSNIFHVAGRPGSGKSTLMKYLCLHENTRNHLQKWAGNKRLLFAKFFFWRIGVSNEEKSLLGLIRGILYQILCEVPNLASELFPNSSEELMDGLHRRRGAELQNKDISDAFDKLIQISASPHHITGLNEMRVCLFIDGLDEFDESTINETHSQLVDKLLLWTKTSNGNVKMCVSSRFQAPFIDGFESSQRITLNNLTKSDMNRVISDRLDKILAQRRISEDERSSFVEDIMRAADGVFLCVALLLNSVETDLSRHVPIKTIRNNIPKTSVELENLLSQVMEGIKPNDRDSTDLVLALAMRFTGSLLSTEDRDPDHALFDQEPFQQLKPGTYNLDSTAEDHTFSLLSCFLILRAADKDKEFSSKLTPKHLELSDEIDPDMTTEDLNKVMSAAILARCNGLIEITGNSVVKFMHRSIPEFLQGYFQTRRKSRKLGDSVVTLALAWGYLMENESLQAVHVQKSSMAAFLLGSSATASDLGGIDRFANYKHPFYHEGRHTMHQVFEFSYSIKKSNDWSDERGLNLLVNARLLMFLCRIRQTKLKEDQRDLFNILLAIDDTHRNIWGSTLSNEDRLIVTCFSARIQHFSLLALSGFIGLHEFIDWCFRNTDCFDKSENLYLVMRSAVAAFYTNHRTNFILKVMRVMFNYGFPTDFTFPTESSLSGIPLWHCVVLRTASKSFDTKVAEEAFELWLRNGADPSVWYEVVSGNRFESVSAKDGSGQLEYGSISFGSVFQLMPWDEDRNLPRQSVSLRGLIEKSSFFSKKELLRLIDEQTENQIAKLGDDGAHPTSDNQSNIIISSRGDSESMIEPHEEHEKEQKTIPTIPQTKMQEHLLTENSVEKTDDNKFSKIVNRRNFSFLFFSELYTDNTSLKCNPELLTFMLDVILIVMLGLLLNFRL